MKRIEFLGYPMDVGTMAESVATITEYIRCQRFCQHVVVNVAKLVYMGKDVELARSVTECDIINIDGMGVVWGARFLGHKVSERVAGVDLFAELNAMAEREHFPVFYLGATEAVVSKTREVMQARHPQLVIAGVHHGYFFNDESGERAVVEAIRRSGARLLFVAITSPRKENFIRRWKHELGVDFVMGVGGTFDVVAGKVKRAPVWMQDYGLEWLYRVIQEPGRMWRRYLTTGFQFLWLLILAKLGFLKRGRPKKD